MSRWNTAVLAAEYRAAYYADATDPRIDAWAASNAAIWDVLANQIVALHPAAKSLLDVGSGTGGFLARMSARCPSISLAAVEPSEAARTSLARRLGHVSIPARSAEELDSVTSAYDVITMLQTLEHLPDPVAACQHAHRCLRPGGLLLVTVPNRNSVAVWFGGRKAGCYANGTHLHFFSRSGLLLTLRRAGFRRVRRLVGFGGGQHTNVALQSVQYALRALGWSSELRMAAWR
ncbi:MAG TPA: class I SAM-dependent methyltransferase [Planctomycetota bacterium]